MENSFEEDHYQLMARILSENGLKVKRIAEVAPLVTKREGTL